MRLCKIKCLLFTCLLASFGVSAQDVRIDLSKLRMQYSHAFEAQLSYKLYASYEAKKPFEIQEGLLRTDGKAFYRKLGKVESLFHPDYAMMVDHGSKLIMIQPAIELAWSESLLPPLDSSLASMSDIQFEQINAQQAAYLFSFESEQYKQIKLIFNTQTYQLDRIIYYMQPGMVVDEHVDGEPVRLELSLSAQRFDPQFSPLAFSASQYLLKKGDSFQLRPAFRPYQFVNYLP